MPFKFAHLCDYFERLEAIACYDPPLRPQERKARTYRVNHVWFASNRKAIDELDEKGASTLLSTLLPLRRKDRVYSLQSTSLLKLLGRCLNLGSSARQDLASFRTAGKGDLGERLQALLDAGGPPALPPVSVEDVDDMLHHLAGKSRFSAQSVQQSCQPLGPIDHPLKGILLRLQPVEAKWLVRLILKDFSPVSVDDQLILSSFHFLLPGLLSVQNDLGTACSSLKNDFGCYPSQPDPQSKHILRQTAASSIRPLPGVKVSRSEFVKARSIKHCLQLTARRKWLVERKYDGEYCQIHIDVSRGSNWLKIYSKSGRDSTEDRQGLRDTLQRCLRIGTSRCKIKSHAILVGEMVVFNDTEDRIAGFDSIRKHVSRAGVFLGSDENSPTRPGEHLMIVFFDLLALDGESLLSLSVEERKAKLNSIYKRIHGRAIPAESRILDFNGQTSERQLRNHFAASIARRHEGLVLKPCGVPYLPLACTESSHPSYGPTAVIKLKKDYITGLGDEADLAVIGASYGAQEAKKRPNLRLRFTHFHLGCLVKEHVPSSSMKPCFKFVGTIAFDQCMSTDILEYVNEQGRFLTEPYGLGLSAFEVEADQGFQMDWCFREPFVFEVLGSSYCKVPGIGYMLRHPRVKKVHQDRTWRDCISYEGLQQAAAEALKAPQDSETQENLIWIERLEKGHKRKIDRQSLNTTPRSSVNGTTPRSTHYSVESHRVAVRVTTFSETRGNLEAQPLDSQDSEVGAKFPVSADENVPLPTPPESSPIRERLMASPRKRLADSGEDVCPKRTCSKAGSSDSSIPWFTPRQSDEQNHVDLCQPPQRAALSEITNRPPQRSESSLMTNGRARTGVCRYQHARTRSRNACALSQSVVHVYGLTTAERERVRLLALAHGAVVTDDIRHWERDSGTYQHLGDTVAESQAYKGLRKMILVDAANGEETRACIAQMESLELRGLVQMYDFRMTESMCSADAGRFWVRSQGGQGADDANEATS